MSHFGNSCCSEGFCLFLFLVYCLLRYNITCLHQLSHPEAPFQYAWKLRETNQIWPLAWDSIPNIYQIQDPAIISQLGKETPKESTFSIKSQPLNITIENSQKLEVFEVGIKHSKKMWDNEAVLCHLNKKNQWRVDKSTKKYITDYGFTHGYDICKQGIYALC